MVQQKLTYLFERYISGQLTVEEMKEWSALLLEPGNKEILTGLLENYSSEHNDVPRIESAVLWDKILDDIRSDSKPAHRVHLLKTVWLRYAAAILLLTASVAVYYAVFNTSQRESKVVHNTSPVASNHVLPGSDKAVLTLSDGKRVELNDGATETIKDGDLSIKNSNGQLIYRDDGVAAIAINSITTPKGGQYQLTLADGTKVWLNAASSIIFPTAFLKETREVKITGEVYFEVEHNRRKPFIVTSGSNQITVFGTSFNVNSYNDEPVFKTSLIEGIVRINGKMLYPGQAYIDGKVLPTNTAQDIAWKDGVFMFSRDNVRSIMRQIGRWYDVEVVYEGTPSNRLFSGTISKYVDVRRVLRILEQGGVRFKFQDRTIKVYE